MILKTKVAGVVILTGILCCTITAETTWKEIDGVVSIEAEKGTGTWRVLKSDKTSGGSYIEDPGSGSVSYTFETTSTGWFYVYLRAKQDNSGASDAHNDVFVNVDGEKLYGTVKTDSGRILITDKRPDGMRSYNDWKWTYLPKGPGGHTDRRFKSQPVVALIETAGEHAFMVTHRSSLYKIDKIVLLHEMFAKPDGMGPDETLANDNDSSITASLLPVPAIMEPTNMLKTAGTTLSIDIAGRSISVNKKTSTMCIYRINNHALRLLLLK